MREIPLTKGKVALVDDADYDAVSQFKWHAHKVKREGITERWYAQRRINGTNNKKQSLHRFLMPNALNHIDHKNGNGLDCQRKNMRSATCSQNKMNAQKPTNNTSGFKGVRQRGGRFYPRIGVGGKRLEKFGSYATAEEAARAYDRLAIQYFGEFACLNFPSQ